MVSPIDLQSRKKKEKNIEMFDYQHPLNIFFCVEQKKKII